MLAVAVESVVKGVEVPSALPGDMDGGRTDDQRHRCRSDKVRRLPWSCPLFERVRFNGIVGVMDKPPVG